MKTFPILRKICERRSRINADIRQAEILSDWKRHSMIARPSQLKEKMFWHRVTI